MILQGRSFWCSGMPEVCAVHVPSIPPCTCALWSGGTWDDAQRLLRAKEEVETCLVKARRTGLYTGILPINTRVPAVSRRRRSIRVPGELRLLNLVNRSAPGGELSCFYTRFMLRFFRYLEPKTSNYQPNRGNLCIKMADLERLWNASRVGKGPSYDDALENRLALSPLWAAEGFAATKTAVQNGSPVQNRYHLESGNERNSDHCGCEWCDWGRRD
jgi:hypothetical protein